MRLRATSILAALMLIATACGTSDAGSTEASPGTTTGTTSPIATPATSSEDATPGTTVPSPGADLTYAIVDTAQTSFFNATTKIAEPATGGAFYGQDAGHTGNQPAYTGNGDGTVTDEVTGLVWQQTADTGGDGEIGAGDKLTFEQANAYCEDLSLAGSDEWDLPTIKQLYSLILFTGIDPSGYEGGDTSGLVAFIDTSVFDFAYGDTSANERIIDAQYASSTRYVSTEDEELLFGVNFADGRIKGYGMQLFGRDKTFYVMCVQPNDAYGVNAFVDNGDGTVTDAASGLMWSQGDSGVDQPEGLDWEDALAYVQALNEANHLGYDDWRLPNVKELQSIVDYTRSPHTTGSAAIDEVFDATPITSEQGETDYAYYWSSTTHENWSNRDGAAAAYVSFGSGLGFMNGDWRDVHGAGSQRSDPKTGDPTDYPEGHGPQGDAIRILNFVRVVRDA